MIGIYINFDNAKDLERIEAELEKIGGYEVGGHSTDERCWKLCEYSVDDEECDFTEEECQEMRRAAEGLLKSKNIKYSITVSA